MEGHSRDQKQDHPKVEIGSAPRAPSGGEPSQCQGHLANRQMPEVVRKSRGLQCRKEAVSQRAQTHMRVFKLCVLVFNNFSVFFNIYMI